ncbi:MAG: class I SAM-dependent methyltransferase [Candidatus Aminicenantaceae bacterium]
MKHIKLLIKKLGYNQLRNKLYNEFIETVLHPFAVYGKISISEGSFLMKLVRETQAFPGPIIEVGTLFGYSTITLIYAKDPRKKLITVDDYSWNPCGLGSSIHFDLTKEILKEAVEKYSVHSLKMNKQEFYKTYDETSPSLVFLDADHSYESTLEDLKWAKRVGAKVICGHDYKEQTPGVIQAVNEVCGGAPSRVHESIFVL